MIDVAAEITRLEKELEKFLGEITKVQDKLNNQAFVQKAPPPVLADHQKRLAEWQARHEQTKKLLDGLKG
jgi:valyl-tRNA synthetase